MVSSLYKDQIGRCSNMLLRIIKITYILQVKPKEHFRQDVYDEESNVFFVSFRNKWD